MQSEIMRKKLYDLTEREKELNCLYRLEDILQDFKLELSELLSKIVNVIPCGWQFPEICECKIEFEDRIYRSPNYKRTTWRMSEKIIINEEKKGEITILYLPSSKIDSEQPFLQNEFKLLKSISKQISNYIYHRHLLETFGAWTKAKETLDILEEKESAVLQILKNADVNQVKHYLEHPSHPIANQEELSVILEPHSPQHWKWRRNMVEKIAEKIDSKKFGVKAIYYFGSTKNACAGPASDIDILLHLQASDYQKQKLQFWLEGWSLCLSVINELKTGYKTNGLLDYHFIDDDDIKNHTSFAVKIGATTDAARLLKNYEEINNGNEKN